MRSLIFLKRLKRTLFRLIPLKKMLLRHKKKSLYFLDFSIDNFRSMSYTYIITFKGGSMKKSKGLTRQEKDQFNLMVKLAKKLRISWYASGLIISTWHYLGYSNKQIESEYSL